MDPYTPESRSRSPWIVLTILILFTFCMAAWSFRENLRLVERRREAGVLETR